MRNSTERADDLSMPRWFFGFVAVLVLAGGVVVYVLFRPKPVELDERSAAVVSTATAARAGQPTPPTPAPGAHTAKPAQAPRALPPAAPAMTPEPEDRVVEEALRKFAAENPGTEGEPWRVRKEQLIRERYSPEGRAQARAEEEEWKRREPARLAEWEQVVANDEMHMAMQGTETDRKHMDFKVKRPAGGRFSFRSMSFGESRQGYYRDTKISGEIVNETGKDVAGAIFTVTLFDHDQALLASETVTVQNIPAGATKVFIPVTVRETPFLRVTWYKLQFDSAF